MPLLGCSRSIILLLMLHIILSRCVCDDGDTGQVDRDITAIQGKPLGVGLPRLKADEVDGFPTAELFFNTYVVPQRPLVMRGAAKTSPAFYKWTDEYFLSLDIPADETIDVEKAKKENRHGDVLSMHFHEFLRTYNSSDVYLVQDLPHYLKPDLDVPCPLRCPHMRFIAAVIWFSSGGTKSVLHNDMVDNVNCLYRGRKEMLFIDFKYSHLYHLDQPEGSYSGVDVDSVDYEKYTGLAQVEYYTVNMTAGDCVFIPFLWAHQVRSYGSNLAVNLWWRHSDKQGVDRSHCGARCGETLTYDQIDIGGSSDHVLDINPSDIKYKLSTRIDLATPVTFEQMVDFIFEEPFVAEAAKTFGVSELRDTLRDGLAPIDGNGDGSLSKLEMTTSADEHWDGMVQLYTKFINSASNHNENADENADENEELATDIHVDSARDEL